MTTLREAAQQALEALENTTPTGFNMERDKQFFAAITALRAALAQKEQEPVLVVEKEPDYMSCGHFYEGSKPFIDPTEVWKLPIGTKLYTQPPCREWQSLADEDMENLLPLYSDPNADAEMLEFAAAIEAKLKEKNA
jgi:hypothetical protein